MKNGILAVVAMLAVSVAEAGAVLPLPGGERPAEPGMSLVARAMGKVNDERVNIRSGPDKSYNIIITVDKGTELGVRSYKNGWFEVELPQGAGCWVYKEYVKVDMPEAGLDAGVPLPGIITGTSVRLRAAPDMLMSNVLGELNKDDRVEIIGKAGDWYKVRPPTGTSGWMYAKYIDLPAGVRVAGQPLPGEAARAVFEVSDVSDMPLPIAAPGAAAAMPVPAGGALPELSTFGRAEALMADELKKPPLERDFSEAIKLYNRALTASPSAEEKKAAQARLRQIFALTPRRELAEYMLDLSRRIESEIKQTEKRYETQIETLRAKLPPAIYTARGTLYLAKGEPWGIRYRLKMGDISVYLIKASGFKFDHLVGKEVGVIGEVQPPPPGYDTEVINAVTMEPLR